MPRKIFIALFLIITFLTPSIALKAQDVPTQPVVDSDKISLDFKGMDIVDVLKLLAQRGNMNISINRNVTGRVTIFLKDVNIYDAFEIVLASNDLAYEEKNGIINVMTERDYEQLYGVKFSDKREIKIFHLKYAKATTVSKALDQVKTKVGKVVTDEGSNTLVVIDAPHAVFMAEKVIKSIDVPTETRIFALDYAKAEDIKAKLEERLTKDIGAIQIDERTNKIIVTDLTEKMTEMERVVAELDERTKQVLIEAKIIQITLNDEFSMGVNWDYIFHVGYNIAAGANFTHADLGSILQAATGSTTGGAFQLGALNDQRHQYVLEVLQSIGKTEILSAPRITVINNEEASILVGSSQPYATTGAVVGQDVTQTTQEVTYVDLGISLHVTPTINRDGFITMKIKPEISSAASDPYEIPYETGSNVIQIPIIQTSTTETTVMVKDANTIVIAGLIEDRSEESEDKIPFLGDLPLIGNAFKRQTKGNDSEAEKKEIVIFLTPYIVSGEDLSPEVDDYLTTAEVGKSEIKQPDKKELSKITLFGEKPQTEKLPKRKTDSSLPSKTISSKDYYNTVRTKVYEQARHNYPRSSVQGNVYVAFDLLPDGQLKNSPRILGYAEESLKMLAIKSVYEAAPFPPFPSDLKKGQETFKILISYK